MRTFLAVELPEDVRTSLAQVISRLRKSLRGRMSWVRESDLHITMRFLGDVDESGIETFSIAIAAAAAQTSPPLLRLTGLGVYPSVRRARVLWCGGHGDLDALTAFQGQCEEAARLLGLTPENRTWKPHATLARFRESPPQKALQQALETFSAYEAGEFTVSGVTLFTSELTPHGASYTPIQKFPFSCPPTS